MKAGHLVWRNMLHRKMLSLLTVLSVALIVALVVFLMQVSEGVEKGAETGYGPFELVIGADGSETQLAMNTFYHVGTPTGNIPYSAWQTASRSPEAESVFAITTGDNLNGLPIVGIEPGYFPVRYGDKKLRAGKLYAATGEAVLGSYAAKESGLRVGDTFHGGHGLAEDSHAGEEEGEEHEEEEAHERFAYRVVGILPELHTPDDRAVFTTLDYAWAVHHTESAEKREVTALIVKPKSLTGAMAMRNQFEAMDNIQAVFSSKAVADVVNLVDSGSQVLQVVTALCVVLAAMTLMLSLLAAAKERKRDAGLLRLIGKTRGFVWASFMGEGMMLTAAGLLLGLLAGHAGSWMSVDVVYGFSGVRLEAWSVAPGEGLLAAGALVLGALSAAGPAFGMYKTDPLQLFRA
ncbi:ABC transporter permease [Gorillibacterium sp. sgz5001074]|uniref:ABC transporter permease n=1 Tax=Gorillibacterium sp. sgz5001074 TaxID=3446695 RepID=UPI003F674588